MTPVGTMNVEQGILKEERTFNTLHAASSATLLVGLTVRLQLARRPVQVRVV